MKAECAYQKKKKSKPLALTNCAAQDISCILFCCCFISFTK